MADMDDGWESVMSGANTLPDTISTLTVGGHEVRLPPGMTEEAAQLIYDNYNIRHHYDPSLPITRYKQDVSEGQYVS